MNRSFPVTAFTLPVLALLVISTLLPLASSTPPRAEVLHPRLRTLMEEAEPDTELEVIVQFRPSLQQIDLAVAEELGV